jgi:3-hydroxyisobutyrate dehydrogenase
MAGQQTVGFVGIGNMGAPMVRCLARAGFAVSAYDLRSEAAEAVARSSERVRVAADLPSVARAAAIVITMLPDSAAVRAAVMGQGETPGLVGELGRGSLVVDMSSSFPVDTRALGAELKARGVGLVDAPVSGGVPKAVAGTLAIMAGGEAADLARAERVLEAMGTVLATGGLGTGHAMKALNNYVSVAGLVATAEALVIGQRFGLDGHVMTRVLNASTGKNNTTENKVERYMLSHAFNSGFTLALMEKDIGMAKRLADSLGLKAEELAAVHPLIGKAIARLGKDADHTAIYDYVLKTNPPAGGK